ncbi:MAG: hypothetical protein ACREUZ_06005 [Burkholderiales bacterium]
MLELLPYLIGGGLGLVYVVGLVVGLFFVVWWPVMAFRAMRDVGRIRQQFERLNDILERQGSYPTVSKPNGHGDAEYVPGSNAWTRTGPLNIR